MMSEHVVWNYGPSYELIIFVDSTIRRQTIRNDKMISYTFNFDLSTPIIQIDTGVPSSLSESAVYYKHHTLK